ncbi:MAG: T9SS type A sorting domain-containing protein [bacterium]
MRVTHLVSRLAAVVALVAIAGGFVPPGAQAQVLKYFGDFKAIPSSRAVSLGLSGLASDSTAWLFPEGVQVELTSPLALDITSPGTYGEPLTPGDVPAGEYVTSYMLHWDRAASAGDPTFYQGRVRFDGEILGLILTDASLDASDSVLGLAMTYPGTNRQLELSTGVDSVQWTPDNVIRIDARSTSATDEIRVILRAPSRNVSFSITAGGPSVGMSPSFGPGALDEHSILTPGPAGAPGPNPASSTTGIPPGVMRDVATLLAGTDGVREVDALSFGHDFGGQLHFSVDEYASGVLDSVGLYPEGVLVDAEASADLFRYRGPLFADTTRSWGNRQEHDGDGSAAAGYGLVEPNPPLPGAGDHGDDVDGVDVGTTVSEVAGRCFFSLDAAFIDMAEGLSSPPNYGSAAANMVGPGDILTGIPGFLPSVYVSASELGLETAQGEDDVNGIAIWDDGDGEYQPGTDRVLFTLRRGSWTVEHAVPDSRLGLPITESDILRPGSPPAIVVPGEAMGLCTRRNCVGSDGVWDDVNAIDRYPNGLAPIANDDRVNPIPPGSSVIIDVLANDASLIGQTVGEIAIMQLPEWLVEVLPDQKVLYTHMPGATSGADTLDTFTYVYIDTAGEVSAEATVTIPIASAVGVEEFGDASNHALRSLGPNPFRSGTSFSVSARSGGRATLAVYSVSGRLVRQLLDREVTAGWRGEVEWDGNDASGQAVAAGVYLVRLVTPEGTTQVRTVRLR